MRFDHGFAEIFFFLFPLTSLVWAHSPPPPSPAHLLISLYNFPHIFPHIPATFSNTFSVAELLRSQIFSNLLTNMNSHIETPHSSQTAFLSCIFILRHLTPAHSKQVGILRAAYCDVIYCSTHSNQSVILRAAYWDTILQHTLQPVSDSQSCIFILLRHLTPAHSYQSVIPRAAYWCLICTHLTITFFSSGLCLESKGSLHLFWHCMTLLVVMCH